MQLEENKKEIKSIKLMYQEQITKQIAQINKQEEQIIQLGDTVAELKALVEQLLVAKSEE